MLIPKEILGLILIDLVGAAGAGLIIFALVLFQKTREMVTRCLDTDGTVVRYENDVDGDPSYPVISYRDGTGRTFEIMRPSYPRHPIGAIIRVTYYPPDPANAWTSGTNTPWVIPSVMVLAGAALIVTMLVCLRN